MTAPPEDQVRVGAAGVLRPRPRRRSRLARHAPVGMLVLAALSWGASTALTKVALAQLTPTDLFGIEIAVSAAPLGWLAFARGARPRRPDPLVLALGVLEPGLTYLLFDLGVVRTAASHAALLLTLDSPVTLLLAAAFLRERVNAALLTSLVLGVTGSALVTWQADGAGTSLLGDVLVLGSAVTAAGYGVLARHVAPDRDAVVLTATQMLAAVAIAAPVFGASLLRGGSGIATADAEHLALAGAIGVLGGFLPFLLFNHAITRLTATRASLLLVLVPVIGAGLAVLLLHESITTALLAGGALSLLAALIAAGRPDDPADPALT